MSQMINDKQICQQKIYTNLASNPDVLLLINHKKKLAGIN
jgi:hypothetical protein